MSTPKTVKDQQGRRYQIGSLLGCGAQAEVYEAQGPNGRTYAIKLFNASPTVGVELQRAQTLMAHVQSQNLKLPASVPLAMIQDGPQVGYVCELVPSATVLEDVINAGQIQYSAALEIVAAVWQALANLHNAGLVHGDVHAKNVLLSQSGLVLIDLDNFALPGLAGLPNPPFLGDLHVMAPELRSAMLQGQPAGHLVTYASDVYAANALTYLLLVGDDDNMDAVGIDALHKAKLSGQWNGDPLGAGKSVNLNPSMLPVSLMSLVRQAWRGEPHLRPSAVEFAHTLQQVLADASCFTCAVCSQPVFANSHLHHCPHCRTALPAPALVNQAVKLVVDQGALTVGRNELGGDPAISSKHAVLQRMGPLLRFTERSSYGASQRNRGQGWEPIARSSAVVLKPGERLRLGNTEFDVAVA